MLKDFGIKITNWYEKNKRELPWRTTSDPFKIWLSEVILQQTRVEQGKNYYLKFTDRFPDVFALSQASQKEIYKMWQGLGYYNRADNLMAAAQTIVNEYQGIFPDDPVELLKIKGIGPYTSAAIASIAFDYPVAVVDGNVFRVLSRIFGIQTAIDTSKGKKEFEVLARELLADNPPGIFNQAVMEFGALYCKPKNPDCKSCIFFFDCEAARSNTVEKLPVKRAKITIRNRYFYYLLCETNTKNSPAYYLKQRDKKDIWKHLYEFPMVEMKTEVNPIETLNQPFFESLLNGQKYRIASISSEYQHLLTHQKIHAVFMHLIVDKNSTKLSEKAVVLVNKIDLINYPVPRLLERFLQDQKILK